MAALIIFRAAIVPDIGVIKAAYEWWVVRRKQLAMPLIRELRPAPDPEDPDTTGVAFRPREKEGIVRFRSNNKKVRSCPPSGMGCNGIPDRVPYGILYGTSDTGFLGMGSRVLCGTAAAQACSIPILDALPARHPCSCICSSAGSSATTPLVSENACDLSRFH